jgi:hypothetical protein
MNHRKGEEVTTMPQALVTDLKRAKKLKSPFETPIL